MATLGIFARLALLQDVSPCLPYHVADLCAYMQVKCRAVQSRQPGDLKSLRPQR